MVLFHLVWIGGVATPRAFDAIGLLFELAVQFFFVLSGFSLTASHFARPSSVERYLWKRYCRLAPLFAVVMIYTMIATQVRPSMSEIALNLSLLFAFAPPLHGSLVAGGWSIGVEAAFYLILPVILLRPCSRLFACGKHRRLRARCVMQRSYGLYLWRVPIVSALQEFGAYDRVAAALPTLGRWVYFVSAAMTFAALLPVVELTSAG